MDTVLTVIAGPFIAIGTTAAAVALGLAAAAGGILALSHVAGAVIWLGKIVRRPAE